MDIEYNKRKIMQFVEGRVFIDVAVKGCGSDCSYCYVDTKGQPQELIEISDFCSLLDLITKQAGFEFGKNGTIISLCPNTEPFKSVKSSALVLEVLSKFLPLGNPVQISSKEIIPTDIMDFISSKRRYNGQVILNISSASISAQKLLEPNTPAFFSRMDNFKNANERGIVSCLYIKPVIKQTLYDAQKYIDIVNQNDIKYVCVGVYYPGKGDETTCKTIYQGREAFNDVISLPTFDIFSQFVEYFHRFSKCIIVHSTICVFAIINQNNPRISLWDNYPELCSKCGNCK